MFMINVFVDNHFDEFLENFPVGAKREVEVEIEVEADNVAVNRTLQQQHNITASQLVTTHQFE